MHAVQTCLHLLWLHLIVILFGTASLAQTVKRLCAGFSPLWFETAVHLFPQSQNTCTYTGARDLSCNMQLIPADVSSIRSDVDVLLKISTFCRVSGHRRLHKPDKHGYVFPQASKRALRFHLRLAVPLQDTRPLGLARDHCTSFVRGKCLCNPFCWNLATAQRAKNAARTIPSTPFLMVVHRGNNHKKPGFLSEWLLTFVFYSNHSPNAGQFPLNMQNCGDKMWDLPFSMHIKDTCHQDVTQELWEQEVQFLRDRLTHHQNHEIRPGKISLWWEKCYTLVHFAYKKKTWNGCM